MQGGRWTLFTVKAILILIGLAGFAACTPSFFEKPVDCGPGCTRLIEQGLIQVEYNVKVPGPQVDILIVSDNSGSMSFEQARMSARFQNLLSQLDFQKLDYRIALTTTDVSSADNPPRDINQHGALQDGRLVRFSNGGYFIESSTPGKLALFQQALQTITNQSLTCENYIRSLHGANALPQTYAANCPSNDERGIFAANLFVDNNYNGFLRDNSHFAVVFLADEDVRSSLYASGQGYSLDVRDLPNSLISNIQSRYPGKTFSFHALIVRPGPLAAAVSPGAAAEFLDQAAVFGDQAWPAQAQPMLLFRQGQSDAGCLMNQGMQTPGVGGSYGIVYAVAAELTNGVVGDVCANDYGTQLNSVGSNIGQQRKQINLACDNPKILDLRFVHKPGVPQGFLEGSAFVLNPNIQPGEEIYMKIECPDMN